MQRRFSIWDEMRQMQERMDSLFDNFFDASTARNSNLLMGPKNKLQASDYARPLSDVYETEKELIAEIEMPGLDKKDIHIDVDGEGISVKAETRMEKKHEDKKQGMYRFERTYSGFSRYFSLPKNVDAENASAEYKDGILKITVPKTKIEEQKRKQLEVK